MDELSYIELFAGCGGMSLGLDSTGMRRLLSNELSPMAAETYAYNLLGVDLSLSSFRELPESRRKVRWLQSRYEARFTDRRLQENPLEFCEQPRRDSEISAPGLAGSLIVGDIRALNRYEEENGALLAGQEVDVVSGGPPCQSFSMAGLRQYGNQRNRLPWEFANFVARHQPRLVVLENVSGIMRPFTDDDGQKVHVWFEVAKAFAAKGYVPLCLHVNAVRVGVAQNRPRFLMFAVHHDQLALVKRNLGESSWVMSLGEALRAGGEQVRFDPKNPAHHVIDLASVQIDMRLENSLLAQCFRSIDTFATVEDAIDDLIGPEWAGQAGYAQLLSQTLGAHVRSAAPWDAGWSPRNNQHRGHTSKVQARFRLYQAVEELASNGGPTERAAGRAIFDRVKGKTLQDPKAADLQLALDLSGRGLPLINTRGHEVTSVDELRALLHELVTHKHTQKALGRQRPAPAALSIPDDACHYQLLRTLSVREMARIQSFPDEFVFRSQPTTGGHRRRFQVPQYTQVGNAVPPRLARQIGLFAQALLKRS